MPDLWPLFSPYVLPPLIVQGLALVVALASGVLYLLGLLVPVMGRSGDVLWSGLALFYGLVLWFGGGQFQGVALAGQMVSVALLLGLGAQVLRLRWAEVPEKQKILIPLVRRLRRWQADRQVQQQIQAEARQVVQAERQKLKAAKQQEKAAKQAAKQAEQERKRRDKAQQRQEQQAQRLAQLAEKRAQQGAQQAGQGGPVGGLEPAGQGEPAVGSEVSPLPPAAQAGAQQAAPTVGTVQSAARTSAAGEEW
ncbi:MAG: Ycf66 family protein, partial [Prochlorothrix sp.]